MPTFEIISHRLRLSSCRPSDANNPIVLAEIRDILSPIVTRSLPSSFQNLTTAAQVREWLLELLSSSDVLMMRTTKPSLKLIGFVFIAEVADNASRCGHLGYLLAESHWRQGLASEALKAVLEHSQSQARFDFLVASVEKENQGSIILLEKLGFTLAKTSGTHLAYHYRF